MTPKTAVSSGMISSVVRLDQILDCAKSVGISGHVRPDGDCVGSCLGLALWLWENRPDIKVNVHLEEVPDVYRFLKGSDRILTRKESRTYDVFFMLDCSSPDRLGQNSVLLENAKKTVCIDHHATAQFWAQICYVEPEASSTSELIALLLGPENLSVPIAEALYTGMIQDTGIFQYSCTSSRTMNTAGKLMDLGIDYPTICEKTFFEKTYVQNRILGLALEKSILYQKEQIIVSAVTKEEMNRFGASGADLEGISAGLRNTAEAKTAVFLHESFPGEFRVSMRSSGTVDVSRIALHFGGGGHVRAAGCSVRGEVQEVIDAVVEQIRLQLAERDTED